jgi:hypothetical protein
MYNIDSKKYFKLLDIFIKLCFMLQLIEIKLSLT